MKIEKIVRVLLFTVSTLGGGLASIVLTRWLVNGGGGVDFLPFILGAAFGLFGWFLAENIGEAIFLLLATGVLGMVIFTHLQSETWQIVVIAFLCGFNTGKFCGAIYREYGD
jgi:hypothetical protein